MIPSHFGSFIKWNDHFQKAQWHRNYLILRKSDNLYFLKTKELHLRIVKLETFLFGLSFRVPFSSILIILRNDCFEKTQWNRIFHLKDVRKRFSNLRFAKSNNFRTMWLGFSLIEILSFIINMALNSFAIWLQTILFANDLNISFSLGSFINWSSCQVFHFTAVSQLLQTSGAVLTRIWLPPKVKSWGS